MHDDRIYPSYTVTGWENDGYSPLYAFARAIYDGILKTLKNYGAKPDDDGHEAMKAFKENFARQIHSLIVDDAILDMKTGEIFVPCARIMHYGAPSDDTSLWFAQESVKQREVIGYTKMIQCTGFHIFNHDEQMTIVKNALDKHFWPVIHGENILGKSQVPPYNFEPK